MPEYGESQPILTPREQLDQLRGLKRQLDGTLPEASVTGNYETAEALRQQIDIRISILRKELNPFERIINISEQYENQKQLLIDTGILRESGNSFVDSSVYGEHTLPTLAQIQERLQTRYDEYEEKIQHGFTKLLIVPFGHDIKFLADMYRELLLSHFSGDVGIIRNGRITGITEPDSTQSKLFNQNGTPLNLNKNHPVSVPGQIDTNLVYRYYHKELHVLFERAKSAIFSQSHSFTTFPGWSVVLLEDKPQLPEAISHYETPSHDRLSLPYGQPNSYESMLRHNKSYALETGMIPEEWLMYAMTELAANNRIIDEDEIHGGPTPTLLIGARNEISEALCCAYWDPHNAQAVVSLAGKDKSTYKVRTVVRL